MKTSNGALDLRREMRDGAGHETGIMADRMDSITGAADRPESCTCCSDGMADEHRTGILGEGMRAQQAGDHAEAERLLRQAVAEGEPDAGYYLGELLIELDRSGEAVDVLRQRRRRR